MNTCYRLIGLGSVILIVLTGCSHLPTQFGGSWPLPAERQSSAVIELARPVVQPADRGLHVEGYVTKQTRAVSSTANSHVDVQLLDAGGTVLQEQPVAFSPGDLEAGSQRSRPFGRYEVIVTVPPGAAHIRVVAHDRPHGT